MSAGRNVGSADTWGWPPRRSGEGALGEGPGGKSGGAIAAKELWRAHAGTVRAGTEAAGARTSRERGNGRRSPRGTAGAAETTEDAWGCPQDGGSRHHRG